MTWEKFGEMCLDWLMTVGAHILGAAIVIVLGWWLAKFVRKVLSRAMEN